MRRLLIRVFLLLVPACVLTAATASAQWSPNGRPLCLDPANQSFPAIAPDGFGGAIVGWMDIRSGMNEVYANRINDTGAIGPGWPANGLLICATSGDKVFPRAISDGAGGAILVWQDLRNGSDYDLFAQRVTTIGTFVAGWPTNGRRLTGAVDNQKNEVLVGDGAGGAIVAWQDSRATNDDIYAMRVTGSGVLDPSWTVNGKGVCMSGRDQQFPAITDDAAGGAFITWMDFRSGSSFDIYAQRVLGTGATAPGWTDGGVLISNALNGQIYPSIAPDGTGGAFIAWEDMRAGSNSDIYAQHLDAAGAVVAGWPANGRAVCTLPSEQFNARIVADGSGGCVVVWEDYRNGNGDLFALRLLGDGSLATGYVANGVPVSAASGTQSSAAVVADGTGGVLVSWLDDRAGNLDIFGSHLLPTGAIAAGFDPNGNAVCDTAGAQLNPVAVSDAQGGTIVAWHDYRIGSGDIYAQRFGPNLALPVGAPAPATRAAALSISGSNPFRDSAALRFALERDGAVTVSIEDVAGRAVRSLANRHFVAGTHTLTWDGRDARGDAVNAGVYFVRAHGPGLSSSVKLVRMR